ncbi:MAG: DUF1588 domain-containing protein [Phycisphaeraceae bacterium]
MSRSVTIALVAAALASGLAGFNPPSTRAVAPELEPAPPVAEASFGPDHFDQRVRPFLDTYCASCHNRDKAKAGFRVDDISPTIARGQDIVRWEKAQEMIALGDMPPMSAEAQPTDTQRKAISDWIGAELSKVGRGKLDEALLHPDNGNRVPHEALFSGEHKGPASSPPRLWRISRAAYAELVSNDGSDLTLAVVDGHSFRDYATLIADEAAVNIMLQSTDVVAALMIGEQVTLKRKSFHGGHKSRLEQGPNRELVAFCEKRAPSAEDYAHAVHAGYTAVFEREPDPADHAKYLALLRDTSAGTGHRIGTKTMLRAMMMSPQFIFRMELGLGEPLPDGRRMLSPMELAYAIGFAILDAGPDTELIAAAEQGRLETRADVEREVRRLLAIEEDPRNRIYQMDHRLWEFKPKKARLLRFFREYFGYTAAVDVFKDDTRSRDHYPVFLVRDADQLVLYAIEQDKQVLEFLLTTDKYFACHDGTPQSYAQWLEKQHERAKEDDRTRRHLENRREHGVTHPSRLRTKHIPAYNLDRDTWNYEPVQPFKQPVPRAGMLTHPAWLIAHSGNFDNDIVRRGKWIREKLLADVVPELPIGVDAQLTTDATLTLREKFQQKVYNDACWRCHKKMNPLGDPFETYNDFGQYREVFHYDGQGNVVGSPKELHQLRERADRARRAGKDPAEFLTTTRPVDSTGVLTGTGDPRLDGEVENAVDLMHRLANSERVRQSFVRHAFRYWMGRNETLDDSPTLIAADRAYTESNGSFNELLVSLLTSDSFLYRK